MTNEELDNLERCLQNEIDKPENKMCGFGRTRIDWLASDCLKAIRELRSKKPNVKSEMSFIEQQIALGRPDYRKP